MRARSHTALVLITAAAAMAQDPHELVRRSIAQDQLDWAHMKDYTWQAHSVEKRLDSQGKVMSTKRETWETLILRTAVPPHAGAGWQAAQPGRGARRAEETG